MQEQSQDDVVRAIYAYAAEQMRNGVADDKIKASLIERGLNEETAAAVVNNLAATRRDQRRDAGSKNMLYGALWAIGGTAVTVATYSAAQGGGTYVVAWGAILFGAIQFLQGIYQSTSA